MKPPDTVKIRAMQPSDLDAVIALERRVAEAPHWSRSEYSAAVGSSGAAPLRRIALAAQEADVIEGFIIVRLLADEGEVESIVVTPHLRGQGVGKALLAAAAESARLQGAVRLDLEVRASNGAAIRLYQRAGFRETGRRRGYYRDPDEDAVLMSANL